MRHDSFKDYVLDQLDALPELTSKAMFGGHGLYQRDTFFGIIYKGRLYFKTNAVTQALYRARGMGPFRPNTNQTLKHYYEVPVDILEEAEQLSVWAHRAIAPPTAQLLLPFRDGPSGRDAPTQLL